MSWRHRLPFFYGWVVVGTAMWSTFFTGPGQTYSYSIFIDSLLAEFNWSRTVVSSLYSAATLGSGLLMALVGRLVDGVGARRICLGAGALLGVACLWSSFVGSPLMLFVGFFLGRFSGQGSLQLAAGTLAPKWFVRRRAVAIMLAGSGNTLASVAFPLINTYLVTVSGWRGAFRVVGIAMWALYLPPVLLLMASQPEDLAMQPLGDSPGRVAETVHEVAFTQGQAVRTGAFWIVTYALFQFAMVGTGVTFHFLSILRERGYDPTFAAQLLSLMPLLGFAATLIAGALLDRTLRPHLILAGVCVLQTTSYLILAFLRGRLLAYVYAGVAGVSGAVLILTVGVLRPQLFGRRHIGSINGISSVLIVVGSALGPLPFGLAFDLLGGYRQTLLSMALLPATAAVLSTALRPPAQPQ
jgi:MFS family permease